MPDRDSKTSRTRRTVSHRMWRRCRRFVRSQLCRIGEGPAALAAIELPANRQRWLERRRSRLPEGRKRRWNPRSLVKNFLARPSTPEVSLIVVYKMIALARRHHKPIYDGPWSRLRLLLEDLTNYGMPTSIGPPIAAIIHPTDFARLARHAVEYLRDRGQVHKNQQVDAERNLTEYLKATISEPSAFALQEKLIKRPVLFFDGTRIRLTIH